MEESFWDSLAERYDEEIFNTLTSDKSQTLANTIRKYASGVELACDFGCGVGRFVPLLAACAKRVSAIDFSARSLELARQTVRPDDAVHFAKHDLATSKPRIGQADVGLLINVMIMPNAEHRQNILDNARRNLATSGCLIVAVPSIEAAHYSSHRLLEWYCREGTSRHAALRRLDAAVNKSTLSIVDGIIEIQGSPTKHYLREELLTLFANNRFHVLEELRIEYDWEEDFEDPPKWLNEPWPWDWLFVVEKP